MVVNGNFEAVVVAAAALTKGPGASHQHATAMPQFAVERLDHSRTGFANDMGPGGQYLRVGAPSVGKVTRVSSVAFGQRLPRTQELGRAARVQHPSHDAPRRALNSQPEPDLACSWANECPHLIEFEGFLALALHLFSPQSGQSGRWQLRFFYPFGNRVARYARQAHDAVQRIAFQQPLVDLRILPRFLDRGGLEIALMSAGFALVFRPPATSVVAANLFTGALGVDMLRLNHEGR